MLEKPIDTKELNEEERHCYYTKWKTSGLSKAAFCREEGIPVETFYYWHKCYRKVSENKEAFSRVRIKETCREVSYDYGIDIGMNLSNQAQFQMRLSMQQLISLVQGLCDATSIIR